MLKGKFAVSAIFLFGIAIMLYSTPTWMWIGTYYMTSTETPAFDPLSGESHANSFWSGAVNNHPNGPTPYRYVNAPGKQMNVSSLSANSFSREENDFLFLFAHGFDQLLDIWNADGTGDMGIQPQQWLFGTAYTRWVYFQSCLVLHASIDDLSNSSWWSSWSYAFRGAQACLGYGTLIYDNTKFVNCAGDFWNKWAGSNQMSIWEAHRQATYENAYLTGSIVKPAIICSKSPTAPPCCQHYYLNDTYNAATSEAGTNYAEVYQYVDYN
jgi:hypothetical protein